MPATERLKGYKRYNAKTEARESHGKFAIHFTNAAVMLSEAKHLWPYPLEASIQKIDLRFFASLRMRRTQMYSVRLFADAGISGKRSRRFQILDDGAEIDRLGIERLVFCDLRAIQHLEAVAFEHFFATSALEGDDLAVNTFFAGAIQITQIRAHERACCRDFTSVRQQIDMEMGHTSRRCWHFAPAMHKNPANEPARTFVVAKIARQRAKKEPDVLIQRIELILQRLARAEQITANFAVHLHEKTRFRLMIGVVGGEKISKQFSILVHWIDRVAEKSGIAAEFPYRFAVGSAIATNQERLVSVARHLKTAVF